MAQNFNVYCDESCHLENDGINAMGLGSVWCDKGKLAEINKRIRDIKERNGVSACAEVKWTKVGPAKRQLYVDLINYFFDDDDLHFRALIVPNKNLLNHAAYHQTHNDWYYKMYFEMLKVIYSPTSRYNVYIDIKDNHSCSRAKKLHEVCCNDMYDFSHQIIRKVQPIRSDEVQIMQLVDILLGAVVYANRVFPESFQQSKTKLELIELIRERSRYALNKTTLLREEKFNLFIWGATVWPANGFQN